MFLAKILRGVPKGQWDAAVGSQQRLCFTSAESNPSPSERRLEKSLNQVTLLGRVGGAPQKRGSAEHPVLVFSLATHANYNPGGELTQKTDWHRICVFKPYLRDTAYRYLDKGQRVMVQGRISYSDFTDDSGASRTMTSIIAEEILFLAKGAGGRADQDLEVD